MRKRVFGVIVALEALLCCALVAVVVKVHDDRLHETPDRVASIPAGLSTKLADQMGLGPMNGVTTKSFSLVDQSGRRISLKALRGRVVVLQFMDPHCTDVCPIASAEVVDAYHDLGSKDKDVAFVTVNVNKFNNSVRDMRSFTDEHGLTAVPTWHFVTGAPVTLARVWHDYGVEVIDKGPNADVIHSTQVYFVGPGGRIRYVAMTNVDYTKSGVAYFPKVSQLAWGHGIAVVAASLIEK